MLLREKKEKICFEIKDDWKTPSDRGQLYLALASVGLRPWLFSPRQQTHWAGIKHFLPGPYHIVHPNSIWLSLITGYPLSTNLRHDCQRDATPATTAVHRTWTRWTHWLTSTKVDVSNVVSTLLITVIHRGKVIAISPMQLILAGSKMAIWHSRYTLHPYNRGMGGMSNLCCVFFLYRLS